MIFFLQPAFRSRTLSQGQGAENVIPGRLEMLFNFRFSTAVTEDELKHRVASILDQHGLRYSLKWRLSGAPFLTKGSRLVEATQSALEEIVGQRARPDTGGGTSDGRFIAPTGAEVVELGPLNGTIHKINEHTPVQDIETLSRIYERILSKLLIEG